MITGPAVIAIAAIGLSWTSASRLMGSAIFSLNNPGSTTLHEIEVEPGDTFQVDQNLSFSDESCFWVSLVIHASQPGLFTSVARTLRVPWTLGSDGIGPLDPDSSTMSSSLPFPDYFGPGQTTIAAVEIAVDPAAAPDMYSISVVQATYVPGRWTPTLGFGTPGPEFIVHVIPEPAGAVLALFGVMAVLCRRRGS
jgi:hypothetical protein